MELDLSMLNAFVYIPLVIITYTVINLAKKLVIKSETLKSAIPELAALTGCVLAVIAEFIWPDVMPSTNMLNAITTGLASGFAATGINQAFVQYKKNKFNQ